MNADGTFDIDEDYVIGEPLDVFTNGTSTLVKGKLYAKNEYAQKFIKLLDQNSSRVRASVGGLVPRVKKALESGRKVGQVVSVLWDDIALTITPVNPTVEPAVSLAKSLSSFDFVKALSAGYGTDSAAFSGGRALQKEDVGHEKILLSVNDKVIAALVGAIADGDVTDLDEAESFLADYGISSADARDIAWAVVKKSNSFMEVLPMAKGSFWDKIKNDLRKSISGKKSEDDKEPPDQGDGGSTDDDDDDDEYEEATEVIKALGEKVAGLETTVETMAKAQALMLERFEETASMQKSIGEGIIAIMDRTEEVIASPSPRKGAVTQLEAAMA
jgi:phage terminase small subunit